jgi:hypothetical protein
VQRLPRSSQLALWARSEFAHARLGDARRTARAVSLATRLAQHPAAHLTEVFAGRPDERQAAYDFVDNDAVSVGALRESVAFATARRARDEPFVFVPVDATSLNLAATDEHNAFGPIGPRSKPGRGIHLMNAIAVSPKGVPLGLCAQVSWVRKQAPRRSHKQRMTKDKETRYWGEALAQSSHALAAEHSVRAWFQLDRGGDAWPVLQLAQELAPDSWVTVRAAQDRRLVLDPDGADESEVGGKLWAALEAMPPQLSYELLVESSASRTGRQAALEVRTREVSVRMLDKVTRQTSVVRLWGVLVRETAASTPKGEEPIEWLLLTTYPVTSAKAACLVVFGYAQRWRIEQFHRALKSGGGKAEEIALRQPQRVERWVVFHSAVAMRLVRLSYLARHQPEEPASGELSESEEEALCVQVGWSRPKRGLTVGEAVAGLACLGGYVGKSSGGPPGFEVLGRGLKALAGLAQALAGQRVTVSVPGRSS